mgnify:FL=1
MKRLTLFGIIVILGLVSMQDMAAQECEVTLKLVETSDVHGCYFPYDFIKRKPMSGSLARVSSFVKEQREQYGDRFILMDNGDILQGQPIAYYYNYIDTVSVHVNAAMLNYLKYDVGNMGNHDVEAGHSTYDRWVEQCNFPVLGANIIDLSRSGTDGIDLHPDNASSSVATYLKPYQIIERDGVKIAVLGMITPAVPLWLPEQLWSGLRFDDMEKTAAKWMKIIREKENPDVVVGLFHTGWEQNETDEMIENGSENIARNVPGFDVIFLGHDHVRRCEKIVNVEGDSVLLVNPGSMAKVVSDVTLTVRKQNGNLVGKSVCGTLTDMKDYPVDKAFMNEFAPQYDATEMFVSRKVGEIKESITTKDAYFGPSAFVDLIHQLQLDISGADISFCAPLSYNAEIRKGDIFMSDMFNLYKYENMLYVMLLSGKEIKNFLEMSYSIWTNVMTSADDRLMLLNDHDNGFGGFRNPTFNFDSAAGIVYTVDVTKPQGEKINIISMADGSPFDMNRMYKVAVNSYRGNGGGNLLTEGAGIPKKELGKRIISSTDKDLRYYLMKRIEEVKVLEPKPLNQWKFIPEEWAVPAAERDYIYLFGNK